MDSNLFDVVSTWLEKTWKLLCSVDIPGTNISVAAVMLGAALVVFGLRLIGKMFGFSVESDVKAVGHYAQKGGNNKNVKVSERRKGDTH